MGNISAGLRKQGAAAVTDIDSTWDVVVIGGGITGAAVFCEAVRMGLKTLLLEQKDFAWGTSSRSSKMVHGGLRYLKQGKFMLTLASVRERQRLLSELPGLVDPLGFLMPVYSDHGPSRLAMGVGLSLYSLMAMEKQHKGYGPKQMAAMVPGLRTKKLSGGFYFKDAQVDDARLVMRLIHEGADSGGVALNYTRVDDIGRDRRGRVAAVTAIDTDTGKTAELYAPVVVNATGAWADKLHPPPARGIHVRPLRGSHLIFPGSLFPLDRVVSFIHPADGRPVFIFPWEGTAVLGTTDVDHEPDLNMEPVITGGEADYLMEGLDFILPGLGISREACIASIAGVRPVLGKGKVPASKESREHMVWEQKGLVTVTGGKLTTFRLLARDALAKARRYIPHGRPPLDSEPVFRVPDRMSEKTEESDLGVKRRLLGRYGALAGRVVEESPRELVSTVGDTSTLWAELPFAARYEQVKHLSDLMLRRVRIGLLLPGGGEDILDKVESICAPFLSWDSDRWSDEKKRYTEEWHRAYAPPD